MNNRFGGNCLNGKPLKSSLNHQHHQQQRHHHHTPLSTGILSTTTVLSGHLEPTTTTTVTISPIAMPSTHGQAQECVYNVSHE
ncbi:hypothetical protein BLOT_014728 [Blomia tropicalis]|nr:hypothetical protein BLOT_014728 [Blomia tropicalis]